MKKSFLSPIVVVATLVAGAVPAQLKAQETDPEVKASIEKLMEVTGAVKMGKQMAHAVALQMTAVLKQGRPSMDEETLQLLNEVVEEELETVFGDSGPLVDELIPVYARHFTLEEIQGLLAFYETDLGRKTIEVMPMIIQESMAAGQNYSMQRVPEVQQRVMERLRKAGVIN